MLTIRQIDNVVQSNLFVIKGWEHERQEQGATILYTVWTNAVSPKLYLGVFRIWEWVDGSGRCGWQPLPKITPEQKKLRDFFHLEMIVPILSKANKGDDDQNAAQSAPVTIKEAIQKYSKAIETGETPENSENSIYKFLKAIYNLGGGDWQKGWELHNKQTRLSDLEISIAENWILPNQDSLLERLILDTSEQKGLSLLPEYIKYKSKHIDLQQSENIIADNLGGTLTYKRNEQGQTIITGGTINAGYKSEIGSDGVAIKAERTEIQNPAFSATEYKAQAEEPPKPPEPKKQGGPIILWLDWYHAMIANGYKCTLEDVASKSGYSLGYIKQRHMIYRAKPNQKT